MMGRDGKRCIFCYGILHRVCISFLIYLQERKAAAASKMVAEVRSVNKVQGCQTKSVSIGEWCIIPRNIE